jgi:hypothetical protein
MLERLSQAQRVAVLSAMCVAASAVLFPPWSVGVDDRGIAGSIEYSPILSPPMRAAGINLPTLFFEMLAVALIGAVAFVLLRPPSQSAKSLDRDLT